MVEPELYDLKVHLSLGQAEIITNAALAAGKGEGMLPLTVVVLDTGGHMVALKRQDGSGILRADIARGKAWGALGMGIPSRTIRGTVWANARPFKAPLWAPLMEILCR